MTKMPTMPVERLQKRLSALMMGESAWTTPWALNVAADLHCWIDPSAHALDRPGGTVSLRVTRLFSGFSVDARQVRDYQWTDSAVISFNMIPVVHLDI